MLPARLILLLVLLATPWCFGAVQESTQVYVFAAVACVCLCWLTTRRDIQHKLPLVLVPLLAGVAARAFSIVPLPKPVAALVSPRTVQLRDELLRDEETPDSQAVTEPPIRYTLSFRPAATRYDLSLLVLSVAGFLMGSLLFCAARSRLLLCWAVAVNGALLAFFGLLQKLTWNGRCIGLAPCPVTTTPLPRL